MLDWNNYERFDWANARQQPLAIAERDEIETIAADILGLSEAVRRTTWGRCSPPGRFAATVVQLTCPVTRPIAEQAAGLGTEQVGIKIFKATADARREGEKAVRFCREQMGLLPGLPNDHVQSTLAAGVIQASSSTRHYIVQEWITGETLEFLVRQRWTARPIDGAIACKVIEQLLGNIVIPLWSVGTVWWDFRDANFVWDVERDKLTLIDVDSLAAYADEILETPAVWTKRNKGRKTAMSRLVQMISRILLSQGNSRKATLVRAVKQAWADELEDAFQTLGKKPVDVIPALERFLLRLP